jgi:hypothetical protein
MSLVAPQQRQPRCADALFRWVHPSFANLPDHRCDDAGMSFPAALLAACAMFALPSLSLLACDQQRAEDHWGTIDGMHRAPYDPSMRERLNPVSPESLRPSCTRGFRQRQRGKAREALVFLDGGHDSLGGKEGAHASLFMQVQAAEAAGRVPSDERHDRAAGVIHRGRFGKDVWRKASRADVRVNCIASWEIGPNQVQHCRWVTGVRVSKHNVYTLMRGGRARWCSSNHRRNDR